MNDEEYFALSQKLEDRTAIILLQTSDEPQVISQNAKAAFEHLSQSEIKGAEMLLKHITPSVCRALKLIFAENDATLRSMQPSPKDSLGEIRNQLKVALSLLDLLYKILTYLMRNDAVAFDDIPSLPVKFAHILFITFEYCNKSQKTYSSLIEAITEMLNLFRKTQELHSTFLQFLESQLIFDFEQEEHMNAYKEILDTILAISKCLSGVNMKSLADNWKGFICLVQKPLKMVDAKYINLSQAVVVLTEEINMNLKAVVDLGSADVKKSVQMLKVTGFLTRVALKLFEAEVYAPESYDAVFAFWIMIHCWNSDFFHTNPYCDEVSLLISSLLDLCTQSLENQFANNTEFLKRFLASVDYLALEPKQSFAFLRITNTILKALPKLGCDSLNYSEFVSFLRHTFNLTKSCYVDFFHDYNSKFYEDFIVNLSVAILLFPSVYSDVEKLLLGCVIGERIFTALIASDVWCLVLKHSSDSTCRQTFKVLLNKLQELELGMFHQTGALIRVKTLTRRIFRLLPTKMKSTELPMYNPNHHLLVWKIISTRSIPLSHRYYAELIMTDLYDTSELIFKEECKLEDFILFMENLHIISHTNFADLQITGSKLVPVIIQLWSLDLKNMSLSEDFHKHFIYTLAKMTMALNRDLSCEDLLIVLNQLRELSNERSYNLLICDILSAVAQGNSFSENRALCSLITNLFHILLKDKNSVVVQSALIVFDKYSNAEHFRDLTVKLMNSQMINGHLIVDYVEKTASKTKYDVKYLEQIADNAFRHCCDCETANEPTCKKFKSDTELDSIIDCLTSETEKLGITIGENKLNAGQINRVKGVVVKLESILNCHKLYCS